MSVFHAHFQKISIKAKMMVFSKIKLFTHKTFLNHQHFFFKIRNIAFYVNLNVSNFPFTNYIVT